MLASLSAPTALPAGQRCFVAHRRCNAGNQRQATVVCSSQHQAAAAADEAPGAACRSHSSSSSSSKRQVLLGAAALAASPLLSLAPPAAAEEAAPSSAGASSSSRRVFFDVSVDRQPLGRFVVEVPPGAPAIGGQRFLDLAQGKEGIRFRKTRFELIEDGFIQDSGLKELSRQASGRTAITGGPNTELLEEELAAQNAAARPAHSEPGLVSFLVKPRIDIVSKDKIVASKGKLITVTETFGEIPNGSAWAITTQPVPELDATNLVVGRVVEGMDVVAAIAALPRVKDNTGSPFFQAGKASGDKRADVAQRAFNKAFAKIIVEDCGLL